MTHTAPSNFSPRAQTALALARREADRFNHNFVGTEHLLLGLIRLGQGTAVNVLRNMGLDLQTVRQEIEKEVGPGPKQEVLGVIPYTPRVKTVLALAAKEAQALNHTYVGTEHILLGLLREGEGVAARVLKNLRVDVDDARQQILRELDPNFPATALGSASPQVAQNQESLKLQPDAVDTTKRYDICCTEGNQQVVYRNALFKARKSLLKTEDYDIFSDYLELEQATGQTVYVARSSVIKFCEPSQTPGVESSPEQS